MAFKSASHYSNTVSNSKYLDIWDPPSNLEKTGNEETITIESKYANRPDLLSSDLYGTPRLWWTFSYLNADLLEDPIWDFKAGLDILIFNPNDIRRV